MITPSQCRAARALLDWTQPDLVEATGLSAVTIRAFEKGGAMRESNKTLLLLAFEKAGVQFIPENGGGAGVRLARPSTMTRDQIEANAAVVRSQAAGAADDAMSGMDASQSEKDGRRAALTDEPALVGKARGKGNPAIT